MATDQVDDKSHLALHEVILIPPSGSTGSAIAKAYPVTYNQTVTVFQSVTTYISPVAARRYILHLAIYIQSDCFCRFSINLKFLTTSTNARMTILKIYL